MAGHDVHRDGMENDPTIAAFARDLQDAAAATPAPAVGASLAAVLDGRAPTAVYPELVLPGRVRPSRRSLRLRWAVASAAFGIGAGSLGVAGALPGPVQRQVSRMAEVVGVDLPDGRPATTTTTIILPPPTTRPPATTVPERAAVEPAEERPTTADVRRPDGPGRSEDRGQAGDRDEDRRGRADGDDEPEPTEPRPGDDDGPGSDRTEDDDRDGADDKDADDKDADDGEEDRSERPGDDEDEDEDREP